MKDDGCVYPQASVIIKDMDYGDKRGEQMLYREGGNTVTSSLKRCYEQHSATETQLPNINDLKSVIRDCRKKMETWGDRNESQTRYALVDPILRALGHDTEDLSAVQTEVETGVRGKIMRPDYLILQSTEILGVVEAKAFVEDWQKKHYRNNELYCISKLTNDNRRQLYDCVRFGFELRSGYAVLTNGNQWEIYDPRLWAHPKRWGNNDLLVSSILASVCLLHDDVGDSVESLYRLLRRQ